MVCMYIRYSHSTRQKVNTKILAETHNYLENNLYKHITWTIMHVFYYINLLMNRRILHKHSSLLTSLKIIDS